MAENHAQKTFVPKLEVIYQETHDATLVPTVRYASSSIDSLQMERPHQIDQNDNSRDKLASAKIVICQ